jgi:hypothetical protein
VTATESLKAKAREHSWWCKHNPTESDECIDAAIAEWPNGMPDEAALRDAIVTRLSRDRKWWSFLKMVLVRVAAGIIAHFLIVLIFLGPEKHLIGDAIKERRT